MEERRDRMRVATPGLRAAAGLRGEVDYGTGQGKGEGRRAGALRSHRSLGRVDAQQPAPTLVQAGAVRSSGRYFASRSLKRGLRVSFAGVHALSGDERPLVVRGGAVLDHMAVCPLVLVLLGRVRDDGPVEDAV